MEMEKKLDKAIFQSFKNLLLEAARALKIKNDEPLKNEYKKFKKEVNKKKDPPFQKCIFHIFYELRNQHREELRHILKVCLIGDSDMPMPSERLYTEAAKLNGALIQPDYFKDSKTYNARYIYKCAQSDEPILILGETGTGKELIARTIHDLSERRFQDFQAINCAGIPDSLLESELFGYEKGAFTGATKSKKGRFELASKGTLFLDEIGDMPLFMQAKILRVLEIGDFNRIGNDRKTLKFEGRIITATNKNHKDEEILRKDLLYRINTFIIHLQPLWKYSKENKHFIIGRMLQEVFSKANKPFKGIEKKAFEFLLNYHFKGNFRELENILNHALFQSEGKIIMKTDLPADIIESPTPETTDCKAFLLNKLYPELLDYMEEIQKNKIEIGLKKYNWNISEVARKFQVDRQAFNRTINNLGIDPKQYKKSRRDIN